MKRFAAIGLCAALALFAGCQGGKEAKQDETAAKDAEAAESTATADVEPDYITVQHILIAFAGTVPGKEITRTQGEAEVLANSLFERAQGGEDFDLLVKQFTDDAAPGIYKMANRGVQADPDQQIYPRDGMVPAFGDVGFPLQVGEIGMAPYDPKTSPYGWHIIKRLE